MPKQLIVLLSSSQRYIVLTANRFRHSQLSQKSAQLTLSSLLAAVPIITIILAVLTFTPTLETMQSHFFELLEKHLAPGSNDIVLSYFLEFASQAKKLPIAGLFTLLLAALLLLNNFENSVQSIWTIKETRKLRERLLTYWAILTLGPIILAAFISLYGAVISIQVKGESENDWLNHLLDLGSVTLYFLMLFTLNFLTPNADVSIKWAALSAVIGSIGLHILNVAFGSFASFFTNYEMVYGAFAAIPIFLIWLQSSWLIVLASICLCASLHDIKSLASTKDSGKMPPL